MKEAELRRCQIQEWYPIFKSHTIKTLFHTLPESFVLYLLGESESGDPPTPFLLPIPASGADPLPRMPALLLDPTSSLSLIDSDSDDDAGGGEHDAAPAMPTFPDLEFAVGRSISDLGGAVFPKLNWSSPKDATWIASDGSLRCTSLQEIALLLRSSDAIAHDLCHALPSCSDHASSPPTFVLSLRKWYPSFRPEMEFRCFVRRRRLVGISQREVTTFYPALLDRRRDFQPAIEAFFEEIVVPRFASEDYTFDVYVKCDGAVKLVDFNPWSAFTLPLMLEWEEMEREGFGDDGAEMRVVEERCGVRPGLRTAVPYDYLDTGEGSGWDQFLRKADEELRKQEQNEEMVFEMEDEGAFSSSPSIRI